MRTLDFDQIRLHEASAIHTFVRRVCDDLHRNPRFRIQVGNFDACRRTRKMIDRLDHIVLTTSHPDACVRFYTDVLGMSLERFGEGRIAFRFGAQKINLHVKGREYEPKAHLPVPGALDLCFIASIPLDDVIARLQGAGVAIVEGPVARTGATFQLRSIYVRDPDLNLIEIAERADSP